MQSLLVFLLAAMSAAPAMAETTYSQQISRLLAEKCQSCHRAGDIAPFPLGSYQEVKPQLRGIRSAVENRRMPPWKPAPGPHAFRGSFGLSEEERSMLLNWIDDGAPEGNRADLPPAPVNSGDWQLGEPDAVVGMPQPFSVKPGSDLYRCFVLPYEMTSRRWIRGLQVLPGNRTVVHHALLFLDREGVSTQWDGADGQPGYDCFGSAGEGVEEVLGAWAPGYRASFLPDRVGIPLPARGRLVLQLHYHPHEGQQHGAATHATHQEAMTDLTKVGLYFTERTPARELVFLPLENDDFAVPAGAADVTVQAELEIPSPLRTELLVVGPHMHLLGRSIRVEKLGPAPSTEAEPLIAIPDWDFNYQSLYTYEKVVELRSLDRVRVSCVYDNSAENPRNPSQPPRDVTYGESTTDEMCLSFLGLTFPQGLLDGLQSDVMTVMRNSRKLVSR